MKLSAADKVRVRELRSEGYTYAEILDALGLVIAKSSLSYICKDVSLPDEYKTRVRTLSKQHLLAARTLAVAKNKELQARRLDLLATSADAMTHAIDSQSLKVALAMLYLGEGSKWRSYRGLSLGSSDPEIICLYIKLLDRCYGVPIAKLRARVQHRMDQDAESLTRYWSDLTGIPGTQFYKSYADRRTASKPTKRSDYKGVCVIMCSGTDVQLELAAIAKSLLKRIG